MTKFVYIIYSYGEYGPEGTKATTKKENIFPLLKLHMEKDGKLEDFHLEYLEKMKKQIEEFDEPAWQERLTSPVEIADSPGWGGWCVEIVRIEDEDLK